MKKSSFIQKFAAFGAAILSTISAEIPAMAATFGEQEVEQGQFIAVAAPFGRDSHQLLIIEQKSSARPCWSESGSNPVIVEPLLLNFDFSGICGRSTDSNGYSIRVDGEDLGLKYIMRVVERDGELVLIGSNPLDRNAPEIVIGKTFGLTDGFAKIFLQPGWEFARRTYEGRTLGHIYLSGDSAVIGTVDPGTTPTPGPSPSPGIPSYSFRDIANDVYATEIEQAVAMGFVAGFREDNTFRPQTALTREQLVSMVLEGLSKLPGANVNLPTTVTSRPYRDVETSRWSAAKIQWAQQNNIVSGYTDGTFRPTRSVTRAELMAVERRAAEFAKTLQGQAPELNPTEPAQSFADIQGHWAASVITEMSSYCDVASPYNERGSAFFPDSEALRNYAAAATLRMLNCANPQVSN
ncbi:MAG: DUF3747 domain-containing protein [Coleofasciculaceae cyanobacterium]